MGVSFKISKTGTRFRPKPIVLPETGLDELSEGSKESSIISSKNESSTRKLEVIMETYDRSCEFNEKTWQKNETLKERIKIDYTHIHIGTCKHLYNVRFS